MQTSLYMNNYTIFAEIFQPRNEALGGNLNFRHKILCTDGDGNSFRHVLKPTK